MPTELAAEIAHVTAEAHHVWVEARAASDYAVFRPWLDRILELKLRYLACFPPADDPYDVFLDDFEPGMKTARGARGLRPAQAVADRAGRERRATSRPSRSPAGRSPVRRQHALSLELMQAFGAEPSAFRLDPSVHPFCTSFSVTDVRLTTRYAEDDLTGHSLFSTMHEAGHGLYEHGVDPQLARSPLAHGCSSALHESQSRLWENVVGSLAALLALVLPADAGRTRRRARRRVAGALPPRGQRRPAGFIRVDADETSYGLHIILRFELEQELLSGGSRRPTCRTRGTRDSRSTSGSAVPDDRLGCLQDVHWSFGGVRLFPDLPARQRDLGADLGAAREDIGDTDEQIERGDFAAIYEWLREHLYALGSRFTPAETIERVAGGPIDPEPYLRYLRAEVRQPAPRSRGVAVRLHGEARGPLAAEHALESLDAALVELGPPSRRRVDAASWLQARGRPSVKSARRRRRRRQDPGVEIELGPIEPARVPGAVEPLVVVVERGMDESVEAAELAQELDPGVGMAGDRGELGGGQRARLLEHGVGDDELPDVVEEAAGRKAPQPPGGKAELLADLDRKERDAAGVLLGRAVLLGERHEQRADMRAEERLLLR